MPQSVAKKNIKTTDNIDISNFGAEGEVLNQKEIGIIRTYQ